MWEKEKNSGDQHFLITFSGIKRKIFSFSQICCMKNDFNLKQSTNLSFGKDNSLPDNKMLILSITIPSFNDPGKETLGKHCGKRRNAANQHFLLFPQCFSTLVKENSHHSSYNEIVICKFF